MKFSKGDVDEALNHVGNYEIADVYITKDFSIINDNNFKLLDKVFNLTKSKRGRKPKKSIKRENSSLLKSCSIFTR